MTFKLCESKKILSLINSLQLLIPKQKFQSLNCDSTLYHVFNDDDICTYCGNLHESFNFLSFSSADPASICVPLVLLSLSIVPLFLVFITLINDIICHRA